MTQHSIKQLVTINTIGPFLILAVFKLNGSVIFSIADVLENQFLICNIHDANTMPPTAIIFYTFFTQILTHRVIMDSCFSNK